MITDDETQAIVEELIAQADRLGLTWRMMPATVSGVAGNVYTTSQVMVDLDGDAFAAPARAFSLVGPVVVGQRVMVMYVPPDGIYLIGYLRPSIQIGLEVNRAAVQNIATGGVPTQISFDTIVRDVGDFIPGAVGINMIIPLSGQYLAIANSIWASNATGWRFTSITKNASQIAAVLGPAASGVQTYQGVSKEFTAAAGDVINVRVQHIAGVGLNVNVNFTLSYQGAET